MPSALPESFEHDVSELYRHLYDLVYLRNHDLAPILAEGSERGTKRAGWRLHDVLMEAITELDPGVDAPTTSREWRIFQLMTMRYVDGLEVQAIADELNISRRQYFREQSAALHQVSLVLWSGRQIPDTGTPSTQPSRKELLRLEAQRAQTSAQCDLSPC